MRNSDCTALRRAVEEEEGGVPVGATAATTEAPVGFRWFTLGPKEIEVSESRPNTAVVMKAATWRCVRRPGVSPAAAGGKAASRDGAEDGNIVAGRGNGTGGGKTGGGSDG